MTNREKYDINALEATIEGANAIIYYYPKHSKKLVMLVGIVHQKINDINIWESIEHWLDSEATDTLMYYNIGFDE